jgi:hypothetical protein
MSQKDALLLFWQVKLGVQELAFVAFCGLFF